MNDPTAYTLRALIIGLKEKSHEETPCKNILLSTKQGQYIFEVGAEYL